MSDEERRNKISEQVQSAAMTELLEDLTDKCFRHCVTRPGAKMSETEKSCLSKCAQRYLETVGVVSQQILTKRS